MRHRITSFVASALLVAAAMALPAHGAPWQDNLYDRFQVEASGFMEARAGIRTASVAHQRDGSLGEVRLQMELGRDFGWAIARFKGDLVTDGVEEEARGEVREANLQFFPADNLDLKVGRQIVTWGTGDLLFINDLFAKDWESFFIGRDDEYLKAPQDAVKASFFFDAVNLDVVYTPQFAASRYIDGQRLSYWNPVAGRIAGRDLVVDDEERNRFGRDDEWHLRLYRSFGPLEAALYGYHGFWKTPEALDPTVGRLTYPHLTVVGGSLRRPLAGGIANLEAGYYHSRDDENGDDPLVRNSEFRLLAGFEHELAPDFTGAVQYYLEWMQDYDAYTAAMDRAMVGAPQRDEFRHLLTLRLTRLLDNQNLKLSFFAYYSPSDRDAYLRPKASYKLTDAWLLEGGANLFFGSDDHTFWGQFQDNNNLYLAARLSF